MNNNGSDNNNNTVVVDDNVVVVAAAATTNANATTNNNGNNSSEDNSMNEDDEAAAANLAAIAASADRHWSSSNATSPLSSVELNLKTRLTMTEQVIPESLYAPIIYQLCVKVQHNASQETMPAFIMARLSVHLNDETRSVAKNRDGKCIINGNGEFALTSTSTVGTFQGSFKIKFNDVSYNNNKAQFMFKLNLYHPSDLHKAAIWTAESASFKVYARKKQDKKRKSNPNSASAQNSPQSAASSSPNSVDSPQQQHQQPFSQATPCAAYVAPVQQVVHPTCHPPLIANLHVKKSAFQDRQGVNNAKCDGLIFAARPPNNVTAVNNIDTPQQQLQQNSSLVVAAANNNTNSTTNSYFAPSAVAISATAATASSAANHAAVSAAAAAAAAHGKQQLPIYPRGQATTVVAAVVGAQQLSSYHNRCAKKQKLMPSANPAAVQLHQHSANLLRATNGIMKPSASLVALSHVSAQAPQQQPTAVAAQAVAVPAANNAANNAIAAPAQAHAANAGNYVNTNNIMNSAPQKHQEEGSSDVVVVGHNVNTHAESNNNKQLHNDDMAVFAEFAHKFRELQFDVTRKLDKANRTKAIEFALNEFFRLDPSTTSSVMFQSLQKMVHVGLANNSTNETTNSNNSVASSKQVPVRIA